MRGTENEMDFKEVLGASEMAGISNAEHVKEQRRADIK